MNKEELKNLKKECSDLIENCQNLSKELKAIEEGLDFFI